MLVALLLLCFGLWLSNGDFLGGSNVVNTTRQISMLGVFAIGISFVIITGGIDLSIGSVIGLTGVLIAKLSGQYYADNPAAGGLGWSLWIGVPVALGAAALVGLFQGLLITRLNLQPFIVTLGGMLLLRGVSQTIVKGGTLSLGDVPLARLANGGLFGGEGNPLLPYPFLVLLAVAVVGTYLLHFTVFGRYLYAIGGNREAAEYSGIPVKRVLRGLHRPDVAAGGHRLRALRHRGRRAGRRVAARRRGNRAGRRDRLLHHAGHRQRHQHVPVGLPRRLRCAAHLSPRQQLDLRHHRRGDPGGGGAGPGRAPGGVEAAHAQGGGGVATAPGRCNGLLQRLLRWRRLRTWARHPAPLR
jgi:hypothetical protein